MLFSRFCVLSSSWLLRNCSWNTSKLTDSTWLRAFGPGDRDSGEGELLFAGETLFLGHGKALSLLKSV